MKVLLKKDLDVWCDLGADENGLDQGEADAVFPAGELVDITFRGSGYENPVDGYMPEGFWGDDLQFLAKVDEDDEFFEEHFFLFQEIPEPIKEGCKRRLRNEIEGFTLNFRNAIELFYSGQNLSMDVARREQLFVDEVFEAAVSALPNQEEK